jgi:CelD/BcsL family acetyltransferase involved in cellulose biosynthesis
MSGLDAIIGDWEVLMGRISRQSFYHHPYWFRAYLEAYPDMGDRLYFAAVYRGSTLVGVFPTTWHRANDGGLMIAELPFGGELYQADCAIADEESGSEVYACYRRSLRKTTGGRWDIYKARDILRDGHLGKAVLGSKRLRHTVYTEKRCAEIPIGDYDEAIRSLKKKFRGNLNNARSKLTRAGEARFEVERSAAGVGRVFEDFVELEMSGWKGDTDNRRDKYPMPSAIGLKPGKRKFYTNVIRQFADAGCAEISSLSLDDKLIGAQVCLLLNDTSYLVKVAYNENAGKFSPGQLLLDYAYRRYAEEGRIKYYNLITDYHWFEGWNPTYREYVVFRDFNSTVRGSVACLRSKIGAKKRDYHSRHH